MYKNNHRQVSVVLYKLKRNFGRPVTIRRFVSSTPDVTTGKEVQVYVSTDIRRAVVLPYNRKMDFIYDLAFVAANKNFTYGAFFDTATTTLIIDGADYKQEILMEDDIIIDNVRHQFVSVDKMEGNVGYIIKAKALKAADLIT